MPGMFRTLLSDDLNEKWRVVYIVDWWLIKHERTDSGSEMLKRSIILLRIIDYRKRIQESVVFLRLERRKGLRSWRKIRSMVDCVPTATPVLDLVLVIDWYLQNDFFRQKKFLLCLKYGRLFAKGIILQTSVNRQFGQQPSIQTDRQTDSGKEGGRGKTTVNILKPRTNDECIDLQLEYKATTMRYQWRVVDAKK